MKVIPSRLEACLITEPKVFCDHSGFFMTTYQAARYEWQAGIDLSFVQGNELKLSEKDANMTSFREFCES